MPQNSLLEKYCPVPAIANNGYHDWVYSLARIVDLANPAEQALAKDLEVILREAMEQNSWKAVSSNNMFWNGTPGPIQMIYVPDPAYQKHMALINPKMQEVGEIKILFTEGCGSFPGYRFIVPRSSHLIIKGTTIEKGEFCQIQLEYGLKLEDSLYSEKSMQELFSMQDDLMLYAAAFVQHECDHLNGIVIPDIGTPVK